MDVLVGGVSLVPLMSGAYELLGDYHLQVTHFRPAHNLMCLADFGKISNAIDKEYSLRSEKSVDDLI
jgi:hypothetical protein